ncbi:MAG: biotin transporter BioY [Thermoanaerobaculia bacterium]
MQQTTSLSLPSFVAARLERDSALRTIFVIAAASLILALSAQVAIPLPFSPIPMTLQPLAVLLLGAALGPVRAGIAALLYLAEGAMGFPVFSQGRGGVAILLGPTAGYLYAFPVAAAIAGWAAERGWTKRPHLTVTAMAAAIATIHLGGWSWLAGPMALGAERAFAVGVLPFLAGDAVKIALAAVLLPSAERIVSRFAR